MIDQTVEQLTTLLTLGSDLTDREERGKRILYIRRRLIGIKTRTKFCEGADMKPSALKTWENGYLHGLTEYGAEKIAEHTRHFGMYCSPTWLLYGIGQWPMSITDDFVEPDEQHFKQLAQEALVFYQQAGVVMAVVTDEAMAPLLYPDDYVGAITLHNVDLAVNHVCIVIDDKDQVYIRRLTYSDKAGKYNLVCLNPNTEAENIQYATIKQVARIVWIRNAVHIKG